MDEKSKRHLKIQRHHHFDLESSGDDLFSPSFPIQPRSPRRMRRYLLRGTSRKPLLALAIFLTIIFGLYHRNDFSTIPQWPANTVFSCPSLGTSSGSVLPPKALDTGFLSALWRDLHGIFEAHPPSPNHLDQPKHKSDLGFPAKELMGSFFTLSDDQARASRASHDEVMLHLPKYPEDRFAGRGVVMLAGGRYSEFAATSLGMLRQVGSELPVEVWAKDASEEMPGWCSELAKEGIACRRLSDYMDLAHLKHPYQWKVFTMLFSSFREILFLDADDMPIENPDTIFDSEVYQNNGVILWPDYWKHSGSPWLPYILGISEQKSDMLYDEKSVESGQMFWHKQTHWKSLLLATYYNYYGPDYYYTVFNNGWAGWGDKDTFPMALKATGELYHQISHDIITVFVTGTLLGIGMIQANPKNQVARKPLFLHSNIVKWSMRDLLCKNCTEIPGHTHHYHLDNPQSPVNVHLSEGRRIFATEQLFENNIDPEPLIWKTVEHTACRSAVWGNDQVCRQARDYMQKTFGFRLQESKLAAAVGYAKGNCLLDPLPKDHLHSDSNIVL